MRIRISILLLAIFASMTTSGRDPVKKDTLNAMVTYGDHWLTKKAVDLNEENLALLVDSLYSLDSIPYDQIDNIYFVYHLKSKDKYFIESKLDSLFTLDSIPYALINEISTYLLLLENYRMPEHLAFMPQDESPYPANAYYGSWNTKQHNPYKYDLWKKDSSHILVLRDTLWNCDFVLN